MDLPHCYRRVLLLFEECFFLHGGPGAIYGIRNSTAKKEVIIKASEIDLSQAQACTYFSSFHYLLARWQLHGRGFQLIVYILGARPV